MLPPPAAGIRDGVFRFWLTMLTFRLGDDDGVTVLDVEVVVITPDKFITSCVRLFSC